MKVLDRAFIKAYEMGDVDPAGVATLPEAPVRTPVVTSVTVIEKPTPAPVRTSPAPAPLDLGADFLAGISVTAEVEAGIDLSVSTRITRPTPSATGPATRPLLQVDRFAWPEICGALVSAQPEFLPLVEELLACAIETPRLLAITSRHRGEGRTTFLLTVARLLAARGCKVAMVDGDFQNPQLARQLGILPEAGWEDVLSGRLPLPEVLIESNEDQIALLPLRGPVHKSDALTRGPRTASTLDALRLSYQLVLVDVGTLSERARDLVPLLAAGSFDAALLVRDIRMTSPKELSDAAQRLVDAGIQTYGIAENFVSES